MFCEKIIKKISSPASPCQPRNHANSDFTNSQKSLCGSSFRRESVQIKTLCPNMNLLKVVNDHVAMATHPAAHIDDH